MQVHAEKKLASSIEGTSQFVQDTPCLASTPRAAPAETHTPILTSVVLFPILEVLPSLVITRFLLPKLLDRGSRPAATCLLQRVRPRSNPLKRRVPDRILATQTFRQASPAGRDLPAPTGSSIDLGRTR